MFRESVTLSRKSYDRMTKKIEELENQLKKERANNPVLEAITVSGSGEYVLLKVDLTNEAIAAKIAPYIDKGYKVRTEETFSYISDKVDEEEEV